jgi:4-amino-4-deoxy-L-arabinose transferase-like glycosyltransferase
MPAYGEHPRPFPRALFLILGLSFLLNAIGIGWGLPSLNSWAMDEIIPAKVQEGIAQHFSHGWHSKYPPLHYYVLSFTHLPFLLLERQHLLKVKNNFTVYTWLFFLGRLVSVLMGTAIVFLVYLCGCELFERRAAWFAAFITATMGPFVYYAKVTNVDVPYIFWFVFSLLFFARILKRHLPADYLLFAVTAVCAVCTKDQAYGLYVLTPLPIIISEFLWRKTADPAVPFHRVLLSRKNLLALGVAGLLFALIYNIGFNLSGFLAHVAQIAGPASKDYQLFPNSVAGHLQMLGQAFRHLRFLFGWPMFIVCLTGIAVALVVKPLNPILFAMLVPGVSYYLFFISVVLYHYERFLIPIAILMAFFGGKAMADWFAPQRGWYRGKMILLGLLAGYSLWYAASVDINMVNDSRYHVEDWMKKHIAREASIALVGFWECLPRTPRFTHVELFSPPSSQTIQAAGPEYLVINPEITFGEADFYEKLILSLRDYALVLRYRSPRKWVLLDHDSIRKDGREYVYSNLDKINPEIKIYRRVEKSDKKQ